ncbi:MAG: hypothetical protein LBI18_08805 [Planctomycetaceae bacterium]|jgi:hypothetical protein|nr:hypothetical protein [Planctomycetaceae bacterium]
MRILLESIESKVLRLERENAELRRIISERQFVLPNGLESNCRLNTGSELPYGNATFRRQVAHHKVGDVSPKHHVGDSRLAPVFGRQRDRG